MTTITIIPGVMEIASPGITVGATIPYASITELANGSDVVAEVTSLLKAIVEASTGDDTVIVDDAWVAYITEAGIASDVVAQTGEVLRAITEIATAQDLVAMVRQIFIDESGVGVDISNLNLAIELIELAGGADSVTPIVTLKLALVLGAVGADLASMSLLEIITELANGDDSVTAIASQWLAIIEDALATEVSSLTQVSVLTLVEEGSAADTNTLTSELLLSILDAGQGRIAVNLPDGTYDAWAMNTRTSAASYYSNYEFNSFADDGTNFLGAAADGIYSLSSPDDAGEAIEALIKSGLLSFGTSAKKRLLYAYLGYTTDGRILFKVYNTDKGKLNESWYTFTKRGDDSTHTNRVKLARGVAARYWQYELSNIDGEDMEIDELQLVPIILTRRI